MKLLATGINLRIQVKTVFVFTFLFAVFFETANAQSCNFSASIKRIQKDQRSYIMNVEAMDNWIASQKPDGSWDDISYGTLTTSVGTGKFGDHLIRLQNFAAAVSKPGHPRYNDKKYKDAVKKGLEFWYKSKTVDPNWWYNEIYFPQRLGEILILMRDFEGFIPRSSSEGIDEQKILSLMKPQALEDITSHSTGANAIDIARHYIYRGLLTENCALLEATRDRLEAILDVNIKSDGVYQDHGPQIQISSYGEVFCDGVLRLATYLAGSSAAFDINSENFGKVINFIRETQIPSIRGSSWDFSVMGREVSRNNALNANLNYLQKLIDLKIDSTNDAIYLDALDRMNRTKPANYHVREFNKHYWNSDYTQHARSVYLFTVRNTSTRTVEAESGNGENLMGNYFSYGANFISVDGNEYKNIMPYWDWSMIPGSTFPHTTVFPTRTNWATNYGLTAFVGGVSNGMYGAAVLNMKEGTIRAKKSWFFFDNEIVCLGAGITDNSGLNVRTTINQAKLVMPSYCSEVGGSSETELDKSSSIYSNSNLHYIRNGNIGYYFPNPEIVRFTMKSQSGSWNNINKSGSGNIVSGDVFTLWVDHGTNPDIASYSYVVVPGIDSKEKAQAYDLSAIEIFENTSSIQAVFHKPLDILEMIFYAAGTLTHGDLSITVDKPCALMLKNGRLVSVSDPAQTSSNISVIIKNNGLLYKKDISLPVGNGMNGSSVTVDFGINGGINGVSHN